METVAINGHGVETGCLVDEGKVEFQVQKLAAYLDSWDIVYNESDVCDEDGNLPTNWEGDYTMTMKMAGEEEQLEWLIDLEDRMLEVANEVIPEPYHLYREEGCIFLSTYTEEND